MKRIALISLLPLLPLEGAWANRLVSCGSLPPHQNAGARCFTRYLVEYVRVDLPKIGEAWLDTETRLAWSAPVRRLNHSRAADHCLSLGARLPTDMEFKIGASNGAAEVLGAFLDAKYWSSETEPQNPLIAHYFTTAGNDDINPWYVSTGYIDSAETDFLTVCVSVN